tara:strand:- start:768 stop:893 length:126 start_codon:yes stop_codon:yes gene_type:complete
MWGRLFWLGRLRLCLEGYFTNFYLDNPAIDASLNPKQDNYV